MAKLTMEELDEIRQDLSDLVNDVEQRENEASELREDLENILNDLRSIQNRLDVVTLEDEKDKEGEK